MKNQIKKLLNEWFQADWDTGLYYKEALNTYSDQLINVFADEAILIGAEWRMKSNAVVWPGMGTDQYHEMKGFANGIVWYQQQLKDLKKDL